ncbi:MAG: DNA-directed RNA polymerase subunit E'' [Nanoarchaeota archaeon]|nr:DNA-directed RNA polymerase subunit E'' [Nanoarchaeota archaeon]
MSSRDKVCRSCKVFVKGDMCPLCNQANFSRSWKGVIIVVDPNESEIAKLLEIKAPGRYCLWVK